MAEAKSRARSLIHITFAPLVWLKRSTDELIAWINLSRIGGESKKDKANV